MLLPDPPFAAALAHRARQRLGADPPAAGSARRWPAPALLLACCAWWVGVCNGPFLAAALMGQPWDSAATWGLVAALGVGLVALHALLLLPLLFTGPALRPLLALVVLAGGASAHFMGRFGTYMDPPMLRNVLATDWPEARELITASMLSGLLLYAGPPLLLLARVAVRRMPWLRATMVNLLFGAAMAACVLLPALAVFNPLASLMRNQRDLRYLINPAAPLWSLAVALRSDHHDQAGPRQPIGTDATPGPRLAARAEGRAKPLWVVLVVGETTRAANWGLSGYARNTTPQLARLAARDESLVNLPRVTACGTNTETSLPCLFAPVGRRQHDEARIRGAESLLHVAARAGVQVQWRDNQSGCKGVCAGLPFESMLGHAPPGLCRAGHCLDEALLDGLPQRLRAAQGTQLVVLHLIGSHGPAYHRRYPAEHAAFQPACTNDDLRRCRDEEIVNAYDNSVHYTDAVLAQLIGHLAARAAEVDSLLLFVSDHGESLGEHGLYLHGLPWAVAPDVQKQVPMLLWRSSGGAEAAGVDWACLRQRALQAEPAVTHDHVFHTLLTLLDVRTTLHEPAWDLLAPCRLPAQPRGGPDGSGR